MARMALALVLGADRQVPSGFPVDDRETKSYHTGTARTRKGAHVSLSGSVLDGLAIASLL